MDDDTAGKIEDAEAAEPAAAPHPVRYRCIDHERPQGAKGDHPAEAGAFDPGTDHQRGGDYGKGHLEQHEGGFRNEGCLPDIAQIGEHPVHPATQKSVGDTAKGQRIANHNPQHRTDADHGHALDQHRQKILDAYQAPVEQSEAGQGHQQDKRAGGQNPGGVAAIGDIGNRRVDGLLRLQGRACPYRGQGQSRGFDWIFHDVPCSCYLIMPDRHCESDCAEFLVETGRRLNGKLRPNLPAPDRAAGGRRPRPGYW